MSATGAVRVLFLFVDGVGVGDDDPATNPLAAATLPALVALLGGQRPVHAAAGKTTGFPMALLDACLGVPGLPQSATGQTALLTGINAPAVLGEHLGPYPGAQLRPTLAEHSLWQRLTTAGRTVTLANAYPDRYLERAQRGTGRMGAIARAAVLAGVPLRGPEQLRSGLAVSPFLTNQGWREHLNYQVIPTISREMAGRNLARLAAGHDFTLFEYYATDIAGHAADLAQGRAAIQAFDEFLSGVLAEWSSTDVLVLASDHGNVEDATTPRHTFNPALAAWRGPAPASPLLALTDIAPAILAALGVESPGPDDQDRSALEESPR